MSTVTLPFTVARIDSAADLEDVCHVRAESYGRHLPALKNTLLVPDELDFDTSCAVFLCRDKSSGQPLGTMRVEASHHRELMVEQCAGTPDFMRHDLRAEVSRLGTVQGAHPQIKVALMKASYLHCLALQARWMVIGARSDALVRQYQALGFRPLHDGRAIPLTYAGGIPHRVLAFNVARAERNWFDAGHALYGYMVDASHPDITVLPRSPRVERPAVVLAA